MRARAHPGVSALDGLSERLLAAADGLDVALATTESQEDAIYRLRHRQVVEHGWVNVAELPHGTERDGYDSAALHVGAWKGDALVGAMRLVLPRPETRLPVEAGFDIRIEPAGGVVEAGRLVIAPEYRGDAGHAAWGALFARAWLAMRAEDFSLLCGAASPLMVERLRTLGLPFEVVGPPRTYWGVERLPVRLDPAKGRPRWFGRSL